MSPKNGRGTQNSPKIHEYRPNINDLKQFFDDSKRTNIAVSKSSKNNYADARTSQFSHDDIPFEGKSRTDFERVKQKFDSRNLGKSYMGGSSSKNSSRKSDRHSASSSQRLARSSEMNVDECKNNIHLVENSQHFDSDIMAEKLSFHNPLINQLSLEKEENNCNFNLDGFKVSDDDDVSICITKLFT